MDELPRYQTSHRFIATYTGPTEFYSGIQTGDRVLVVEEVIVYTFRGERRCAVSASIQRLDGGPWLVLHNATANLSDITEED